MPSASALRLQIESSLERRFPAALSPLPRTYRETAPTSIPAVDRLLDGGLPIGAISEITGPASSGRTSLALAFLAERTQEDRVCAWVDLSDAFDSESAAASGVSLRQLLWVRLSNPTPAARPKSIRPNSPNPVFSALDQALRATDLLLQAGGFCSIVLDLGSISADHGKRIPLATWFRFRQAADRTRCSLLVLAQQPLAQSSAAVVLECTPLNRPRHPQPNQTVLTACTFQASSGRQRFTPFLSGQRKPPTSTWCATSPAQREAFL